MMHNNAKYLIDSNTLITPYNMYYPFDLAPKFWEKLKNEIDNGCLCIPDMVKNEVAKGKDELSDWINTIDNTLIFSVKVPDVMVKYSEILTYVQTCGYYKQDAVTNWSRKEIADAWIIATASVHGLTVITQEVSNGNLNTTNKARNAKIPDICKQFNVPCGDLFYMMRQLPLKIT